MTSTRDFGSAEQSKHFLPTRRLVQPALFQDIITTGVKDVDAVACSSGVASRETLYQTVPPTVRSWLMLFCFETL